jgi:hypothetical protein
MEANESVENIKWADWMTLLLLRCGPHVPQSSAGPDPLGMLELAVLDTGRLPTTERLPHATLHVVLLPLTLVNLSHLYSLLINTTILQIKISFTWKICVSTSRWFYSDYRVRVLFAVNLQCRILVCSVFDRISSNLSNTVRSLKIHLTCSFTSLFCTLLVL